MPRPRQVSDAQILAAARRCFLAHGGRVAVQRVAEELGVSPAAVFNRFGSKQELLLAALAPPETLPWARRLADLPDERPVREQLVEICRDMASYYEWVTPGIAVLHAEGIPNELIFGGDNPAPRQAFEGLAGYLGRAVDRGLLRRHDVRSTTTLLLGALHGWHASRHETGLAPPEPGLDTLLPELVDVVLRGVSA